jgi:hypothetical protein
MVATALLWALAVAGQCCLSSGPAWGQGANGNIAIEVKNIGRTYQEFQKASADCQAVVRNYYEYKNAQTRKRSISVTAEVARDKAVAFINAVARMGEVQSQNYSEYRGDMDLEGKIKKLEAYRNYLTKVLTGPGPDPDIVSLLTQQVQSVEYEVNRIKQALDDGMDAKASITIQIKERGYDDPAGAGPVLPGPFKAALALLGLACIGIGFLAGYFVKGMPKAKAAANVA